MHTSQFEGAQNKTDLGILIFFIQNLNLGKLVAKLLLDLTENLHTSQFQDNKIYMTTI